MEDKRHYAVIDHFPRKVAYYLGDQKIAESSNALILKEVGKSVYNPVFYLPKDDVLVDLKKDESKNSHCPIKGDATYWTVEGAPSEPYFAWSYEDPLPRSKKIEGHIAFNEAFLRFESLP